jgi:hypothetical protein
VRTIVVNRWIKHVAEHRAKAEAEQLPRNLRGLYVLYRKRRTGRRYDVVYVGLSKTGMRPRLLSHRRSKKIYRCLPIDWRFVARSSNYAG